MINSEVRRLILVRERLLLDVTQALEFRNERIRTETRDTEPTVESLGNLREFMALKHMPAPDGSMRIHQ